MVARSAWDGEVAGSSPVSPLECSSADQSIRLLIGRSWVRAPSFQFRKGIKMPAKTKCTVCGKTIHTCYTTVYNKSGMCRKCLTEANRKKKIEHWLKTGDTGYAVSSTIRNAIRDYLYREQGNKCAICGMANMWNGKELKFVLDHIDGDAANGERDNLRLICPNCDSQLPTYKSRNKHSARKHRKSIE